MALVKNHPSYVSENSKCVCEHVKVMMGPRGARDAEIMNTRRKGMCGG